MGQNTAHNEAGYDVAPEDALQAGEAMKLLGVGSSAFYRLLEHEEQQGHPVPRYRVSKRTFVYDNAAIRRLAAKNRGKTTRRGRPAKRSESYVIAPVQIKDLSALQFAESLQLRDIEDLISSKEIGRWMKKNPDIYWMACDPKSRDVPEKLVAGIFAVLGVLPLRSDDLARRLLNREILPESITADDVETYEPGKEVVCYITSTTALPAYKDVILSLMQHVFDYWKQRAIRVKNIYLSAPRVGDKTSGMVLVSNYFFSPLAGYSDERQGWELEVTRYSPQAVVEEYKQSLQKKQKGSYSMVIAPTKSKVERLEALYAAIEGRHRGYARFSHEHFQIRPDGYFVDREGQVLEHARFRPVESDADIRATIQINASHFGASKRYTEDQLVEQRRRFLAINPDTYRVLEIDRRVIGFINAFPLPMDYIRRNLTAEIKLSDVPPEALLEYRPGTEPLNIYLQTIGIHNDIEGNTRKIMGNYLAYGTWNAICELGKRGVRLGAIYTLSEKGEGMALLMKFGFERCHDFTNDDELVFKLDFSRRDLPTIEDYHLGLEEYYKTHEAESVH